MDFSVWRNNDTQAFSANCELADSSLARMRGLLGRKSMQPQESLWIVPCNSVHTFFMNFPIDVVFLDKEKRIIAMNENMPSWRHSWIYWRARTVLELPAGKAAQANLHIGDQLNFIRNGAKHGG